MKTRAAVAFAAGKPLEILPQHCPSATWDSKMALTLALEAMRVRNCCAGIARVTLGVRKCRKGAWKCCALQRLCHLDAHVVLQQNVWVGVGWGFFESKITRHPAS